MSEHSKNMATFQVRAPLCRSL